MRVCIVEDDKRVARAMKKSFGRTYTVDIYDNGRDATLHASSEVYDVILLDMSLPDMDGQEVCRQLRQNNVTTPIIIVTGSSNKVKSKIMMLDNGADDYITKPFSYEELKARMRAVMRRASREHASGKITVHDLELDPANRTVKRKGRVISLRKREFDLLEYLMRNHGRTATRSMIIDHVWTTDMLWTNAIDVHIKSLRDKIDRPFGSKLIKTIHGIGYKLEIIERE